MIPLSTTPNGTRPRLLSAAGKSSVVCLLAAGLMVACTGQDPEPGPTSKPTPTTMQGTAAPSGSVVGALKELEDFTCKADDKGQWAANGTITNNGSSTQKYTLQVFVADSKTSTVVGSADKSFELAPKKSMDVSLPKVVSSTKTGLRCTPVVTKEAAK
jgi:hypothetical protein